MNSSDLVHSPDGWAAVRAEAERKTEVMNLLGADEGPAVARLLPAIYEELRALAGSYMKLNNPSHTLQPTALVHEVYLRLAANEGLQINNKEHFFAIAAKSMRYILVDHAKGRAADKRGGGRQRVTLTGLASDNGKQAFDAAELDEALSALAELNERQSSVVEMRFFAGMTIEEIAQILDVSKRTVDLDWSFARAWLRDFLSKDKA